jgi:hypothetical protein
VTKLGSVTGFLNLSPPHTAETSPNTHLWLFNKCSGWLSIANDVSKEQRRAGEIVQVVECLPSKCKSLSSNPRTIKKKTQRIKKPIGPQVPLRAEREMPGWNLACPSPARYYSSTEDRALLLMNILSAQERR